MARCSAVPPAETNALRDRAGVEDVWEGALACSVPQPPCAGCRQPGNVPGREPDPRRGGAGLWLAPTTVAAPFSPSRITSLRTSETGPSQTQLLLLSSCELRKPISGLGWQGWGSWSGVVGVGSCLETQTQFGVKGEGERTETECPGSQGSPSGNSTTRSKGFLRRMNSKSSPNLQRAFELVLWEKQQRRISNRKGRRCPCQRGSEPSRSRSVGEPSGAEDPLPHRASSSHGPFG